MREGLLLINMNLQRIQDQLIQRVCPEHHAPPQITIGGNQLVIRCCCETFRRQLLREYESLMYQAIYEDMRKEIKRILR